MGAESRPCLSCISWATKENKVPSIPELKNRD
ncbi:Uncharacterised protein [Vibrio cholerae]|nr:Uncharacterised protein [Vibrio cholerae]